MGNKYTTILSLFIGECTLAWFLTVTPSANRPQGITYTQ